MIKQFVFVLAVVFFVSVANFAQDSTNNSLKDPHNNVLKVDDSKVSVSKEPWNKVCPVKGNPIEADSPTVEYNGKVYAFCCPGCDTKFAKNPEKYAKNLSEDGKKFIGRK